MPRLPKRTDWEIGPLDIGHYDGVMALWRCCEGIGLSAADSREGLQAYLDRNPGMSFVATSKGAAVGAALGGHDGRRGYLHHVAVRADFRGQGIGRRLVERCLAALEAAGLGKCHLFVFNDNGGSIAFWERLGWVRRADLGVVSRDLDPAAGPDAPTP